jgi:hypothetical protein
MALPVLRLGRGKVQLATRLPLEAPWRPIELGTPGGFSYSISPHLCLFFLKSKFAVSGYRVLVGQDSR